MIVKNIISDMLPRLWPLLVFISVVAISIRGAYLFKGSKKFVLHRELLALIFILYVLCLYYILIYQDGGYNGINFVPFKEMFRYTIGSYKFYKNVIGNIILFIPLGFFVTHYIDTKKIGTPIMIALIISMTAEAIQYYIGRIFDIDDVILNVLGGFLGFLLYIGLDAIRRRLPKFMRSDAFMNFLIIVIIVIMVLLSFKINIFSYL